MSELIIIGGGLAGSEAAWQVASRGIKVFLYEMRPVAWTGAHTSPYLAELVCSNSLGARRVDRASGLLKEELRRFDSLLLQCAEVSAIPAGDALAVDRIAFAGLVSEYIENHPHIEVIRQEVTDIPNVPTLIATGPLTSHRFSEAIQQLTGREHLFFYDAIAPVVSLESINMEIAYRASRYGHSESEMGDYINCPMTRDEYCAFVEALIQAKRTELREFEQELEGGVRAGRQPLFEACLPIEILAQRGREALAYGPMRPVGLVNPKTGKRPYAVVQLRQDNLAGSLYNMVGFQTNLKISEQERVFRLIPGLEKAEFVRYGQMHRNTFLFSPALIQPTLQYRHRENLFFAGQIIGIEGYVGNIATGLLAGINAARWLKNKPLIELPLTTMVGALCHYITHSSDKDFQPMKANFGLLPPLDSPIPKSRQERNKRYLQRALKDLERFCNDED